MKEMTKLLNDEGIMNSDYFLPSVMVAFGYRAEDPKRAKTRQSQEDNVSLFTCPVPQ